MEIVPEGKNFRLVTEDELPAVADILVQYMPESLKVLRYYTWNLWSIIIYKLVIYLNINKLSTQYKTSADIAYIHTLHALSPKR
jgi:hypothetical protein